MFSSDRLAQMLGVMAELPCMPRPGVPRPGERRLDRAKLLEGIDGLPTPLLVTPKKRAAKTAGLFSGQKYRGHDHMVHMRDAKRMRSSAEPLIQPQLVLHSWLNRDKLRCGDKVGVDDGDDDRHAARKADQYDFGVCILNAFRSLGRSRERVLLNPLFCL